MTEPGPPPPPGQPPGPGPGPAPYVPPVAQPYPGQQPPPPGAGAFVAPPGFAPAPPTKKRKIWPWILGVVLVLLLLAGGCVAVVYRAATGPIDKANAFLGHIDDGDFAAASELTDPSCFTDDELAQLEAFFVEFDLEGYDLTGTERFTGGGAATGTVTLAGAGDRDVRVDLTNDDGWRICGIDVTGG